MTDLELARIRELINRGDATLLGVWGPKLSAEVERLRADVATLRADRDHARHWANWSARGLRSPLDTPRQLDGVAVDAAAAFCRTIFQGKELWQNVEAGDSWHVGKQIGWEG